MSDDLLERLGRGCNCGRCKLDLCCCAAMEEAKAEIEKLREAGNELGGYAGHDDSCDCVKGWAKGPCNCGYTETWNQWRAALGETK